MLSRKVVIQPKLTLEMTNQRSRDEDIMVEMFSINVVMQYDVNIDCNPLHAELTEPRGGTE